MQRIVGIDPGLRVTGWAVVSLAEGTIEPQLVEAGVFRLDAGRPIEHRLEQLFDDLEALIDQHEPAIMVVENLYAHYRHPRTAILMAHARGVILLAAQRKDVAVEHIPSTAVKKALTGHGHASKEQMQHAVASQCGLREPPSPPDVADAIAIALTHGRRVAVGRL